MSDRVTPIAVVGGGMTGISAALELAQRPGIAVTLLESRDQLGGLSDHFSWETLSWDRFYHVVLSTDRVLIGFLSELGLEDEIVFRETRSGFFGNGKLVSLSSTTDFVRFPFLSPWQKLRLAIGILYSASLKDPSRLDRLYVRQWLTAVFGRRVYERIWDPLLRSKLGAAREETSAAFIWATITRLYGAREGETRKELMGHVHGGYRRIIEEATSRLRALGVSVRCGTAVDAVTPTDDRLRVTVRTEDGATSHEFDRVLLTVPSPEVVRILEVGPHDTAFDEHRGVRYLGVVCLVVVLNRSLSPYYVINLLDQTLPFTGVIEATNVVAPAELGGHHLVYLPKYAVAGDPLWLQSDAEVVRAFTAGLKRIFPDLRDDEIRHTRVFREPHVQPLQEIGALTRRNDHRVARDGVYLANSAMMKNTTLNNNAAINLGRSAAAAVWHDIEQSADAGKVVANA